MSSEEKEKAKRDLMEDVRYDLISPFIIESLAKTYAEGKIKYGAENWRKGLPFSNCINHAMNHLMKYMMGDSTEPHLDHALWNIGVMIEYREKGREHKLNDLYFHQERLNKNRKHTEIVDGKPSYHSVVGFFNEHTFKEVNDLHAQMYEEGVLTTENYFHLDTKRWCVANYNHAEPDHSKCNHYMVKPTKEK